MVQNDEQFTLERLDGSPVRCINGVRVDVERRCNARVSELLLRDLHRDVEVKGAEIQISVHSSRSA